MVDYVGGAGDDVFIGDGFHDVMSGGAGADILDGGNGDDYLYSADVVPAFNLPYYGTVTFVPPIIDSGSERDTLRGGDGSDWIFAGYGDSVDGGADGVYGDYLHISFLAAPTGITFDGGLATQVIGGATITGIENISLVQGSNFADTIDGRSLGGGYSQFGALMGMGGNDTMTAGYFTGSMFGGDGDDIVDGRGSQYLVGVWGDDGNDTLYTGNTFSTAYGGAGNDTIYARSSAYGGSGNDLIILQSSDYHGLVSGESGDDEIRASVDNRDSNAIYGGEGADRLTGGSGTDTIGSAGSLLNSLTPDDDLGTEHDVIDGGEGNDLIGIGIGDDADGGTGFDTLRLSLAGASTGVDFSSQGITGATPFVYAGGRIVNFEDFTYLRGTSFGDRLNIATQATMLTIDAGDGNDMVSAGQSSVTVNGGAGDDQLTGSSVADVLMGSIGNDMLNGGGGADQLSGGAGDDRYIVDNSGDQIVEQDGEGADTVESSIDFSLATLGAVENLTLTGAAAINGTGNALNNNMRGNVAANTLYGGDGNDVLDGGAGGDRLYGGAGDDRYILDNSLDRVIENANEGIDTVESSVSFSFVSLSALENLTLTGIGAINGTGNALANILIGNAAANILDGGTGIDRMEGGAGNDTYYVDAAEDVVLEAAGGGNDTVLAARSYALAAGQEIETLATVNDAGSGFINLTGNEFNNILRGNAGGNRLDGGLGADQMAGGLGNDTYVVDNVGDQVTELSGGGTDMIESSISFSLASAPEVENLTLTGIAMINGTGNALNNILIGNAAANILDGGIGADRMEGGQGGDLYYVDNAADSVLEGVGAGYDTVYSSTSFALAAGQEIEDLVTTDRAAVTSINLTGNEFGNYLAGNAGSNILEGGGGNDGIDGGAGDDRLSGGDGNDGMIGGAGIDQLYGGRGNDLYVLDDTRDLAFEAAGEGYDSIQTTASYILAAGQEIEELIVSTESILPLNLTGNEYKQTIIGNGLSNILTGLGGDDQLYGYGGADTLIGGEGDDLLEGGLGGDRLYGGVGNDFYFVDDSLDRVIELDGEGRDGVLASVSFTLGGAVEELYLNGTAAINGTGNALSNLLVGNAAANVLDGGVGIDRMEGRGGDDTYYVDLAEDVVLEAVGAGNDTVLAARSYALAAGQEIETLATVNDAGSGFINLTGNEFANMLRGNAGGNRLDGGAGIDRMSGGLGNDSYVVDNIGDQVIELDGQGIDTVESSVSFSLTTALENLTLTGVAEINATGNALANVLNGNAAANLLDGAGGNDVLYGGAGSDRLIGGAGSDQMYGGADGDLYYVDNAGDMVFEAAGQGNDRVYTTASYTLAAGQEIEELFALDQFPSNQLAIDLTGNDFTQIIWGNAGNNILSGLGGNDTLRGDAGADTLYGGAGQDTLIGGLGGDRMYGGAGDDLYMIDNSLDRVIELDGEGIDSVQSSVSFSLSALTSVENLTLVGTAAINATGNAGNNILGGNEAANILDGGVGVDVMQGWAGDDTYYVDVMGDQVFELINGGNDTVLAARAYTLRAGQEIETLATVNDAGTGFINLTGNEFANMLRGNVGGNRLDGGLGADTLTGLGGADTFVFGTALGATNVDTITDFVHGTDRIELDQSIFTGLGLGTLGASAFSNGPANTAGQHILYDAATGNLSYDADGSGAGAAIVFATLSNHPANITSADFLVVP
ncbi:hypothetical protein [Sphingomonas sp.]|uniref:hypothetical protein n=1 Tax=Sphingomonas sp. TaxID=28214 RepID=UPI003D6D9776